MRTSGLLLGGLLVAMPSHGFLIQTVESRSGHQVHQTWRHPDRIPSRSTPPVPTTYPPP